MAQRVADADGMSKPPEVSVKLNWVGLSPGNPVGDGANRLLPRKDTNGSKGWSGSPMRSNAQVSESSDGLAVSESGVEKQGEGSLGEMHARIQELEARHQKDAQTIEILTAMIDTKEAEISVKNADLKMKNQEIAELLRALTSKALLVESLQAELEESQLEMQSLATSLEFYKETDEARRSLALSRSGSATPGCV
jgi:predicted RNase H-like nuclease (RuvC/YqgF family)